MTTTTEELATELLALVGRNVVHREPCEYLHRSPAIEEDCNNGCVRRYAERVEELAELLAKSVLA